jgi:hypothetical protein
MEKRLGITTLSYCAVWTPRSSAVWPVGKMKLPRMIVKQYVCVCPKLQVFISNPDFEVNSLNLPSSNSSITFKVHQEVVIRSPDYQSLVNTIANAMKLQPTKLSAISFKGRHLMHSANVAQLVNGDELEVKVKGNIDKQGKI